MSVEFLTCNNCGVNFPDCGEFVYCEKCGTSWCTYKCAEEQGYEEEHCELGCTIYDGDLYEDENSKNCIHENDEDFTCYDCDKYHEESCGFCRHENYEDSVLLNKAMELLNCDRQFLIDKINNK